MKQIKPSDVAMPWYRYPIVWMVILLPLAVVVASIITINIAFTHQPQLLSTPDSDQSQPRSDS